MIRRDFLKTLAAFGAAAAGGGAAVAAASPAIKLTTSATLGPRPLLDSRELLRMVCTNNLSLEVIRGEEFSVDVALPERKRIEFAWFCSQENGWRRDFNIEHRGWLSVLSLSPSQTAFLRPRSFPWIAIDQHGQNVLVGRLTVLPDDLWSAEEKVISIAKELHPMGVEARRGNRYEVGLREKLRSDETSEFSNRFGSLLDHCRPVSCEIINRGMGALIDFEPRGLL